MSFKTPKGTELKILILKGKNYLPVAERVLWFREEHPDWTIKTTIVQSDEIYSQARAEIINPAGQLVASAHKSETAKGFPDHMEKAETGAIGRALALCGYGTQFASEEFDEGDRLADSPTIGTITASPASKLATPNQEFPKCQICGTKMLKSKFGTGPQFFCPNKKNHQIPLDELPF